MKYDCGMIQDLLRLVLDDTANEASRSAVAEHLAVCPACTRYDEELKRSRYPGDKSAQTEETAGYAALARRLRLRRKLAIMGMAVTIGAAALISLAYATGVRSSPLQAAAASRYVDEQSLLLGEAEMGSYKVFFYENDDKYRTILTQKALFFFWKNSSSSWANKTDDKVKLAGWSSMTVTGKETGVTAIPVQSYDHQVAYLEMGPPEERIRLEAPYGKTAVFGWSRAIRWNDLNGIAYSAEGHPLYKLGYETVNNLIKPDELRWLPVEP